MNINDRISLDLLCDEYNVDKIVNYLNATQDANEPLIEHFSNIKYVLHILK